MESDCQQRDYEQQVKIQRLKETLKDLTVTNEAVTSDEIDTPKLSPMMSDHEVETVVKQTECFVQGVWVC